MTRISKAVLAAALFAGTSGLVMTGPVLAKEKKEKKDEKDAGIKLSPDVLKAAQVAQPALTAKDVATAEPAIVLIETNAKTDDDRYIAASFRLMLIELKLAAQRESGARVDESVLIAPYDALIANPKTPPANLPMFNYNRGVLAANVKAFPQAISFFERARQLGYVDPNLSMRLVRAKMDAGDTAGASAELEKAIGEQSANGGKASEDLYRYAIAQTNQKKLNAETVRWMKLYLSAYPTAKNWREMLVFYGLQPRSVVVTNNAQRVDLYRLMRASKSMADQGDYEDYAQKVLDLGLPYETKTVITEGRASGKIPTTSSSATGLLTSANASIKNEGSLAPLDAKAKAAATGKPAAQTADAYLGAADYAKAIALYRLALQKGGVVTDDVNTHLGIALALSGDKAGAKAAFAAVTGAPRADIAGFWIAYLDQAPAA